MQLVEARAGDKMIYYLLDCSYYQFKSNYKDKVNFIWSRGMGRWYTPKVEEAMKMRGFASEALRKKLEHMNPTKSKTEKALAKKLVKTKLPIPAPEGLQYRPFQIEGINTIISNWYKNKEKGNDFFILADDMGLGKTVQAIGVANFYKAKNVLVICPSSLKHNWSVELENWLVNPEDYDIDIVEGKIETSLFRQFKKQIKIINYDILKPNLEALQREHYDLVILDEAHRAKNLDRMVSSAALKIFPHAQRVLFMTGTPIINRIDELMVYLKASKHFLVENEKHFIERYCKKPTSETNLELKKILYNTIALRREKETVLKNEIPPKQHRTIVLKDDELDEMVKEEKKAFKEAVEEQSKRSKKLRDIMKNMRGGCDANPQLVAPYLSIGIGGLARIRRLMGIKKVKLMVNDFHELLKTEEKVVIFAHHKEVIDFLMVALKKYRPVKVQGNMNAVKKREAVEKFQYGDARVFIGNFQSAGVGITLTAARVVVNVEFDWRPAIMDQAADRCHRLTQTKEVIVITYVVDNSVDVHMVGSLDKKRQLASEVISVGEGVA